MIAEILAVAVAVATPNPEFQPLTIGETVTVEALGEARSVNIILPMGYAENPDENWPVVYQLDGGMQQDLMLGHGISGWNRLWGRSEHVIWVGIETKDRQRELLPPTQVSGELNTYPTAGESAAFRDWLVNKLKPQISARYRTDGRAYLLGESAAGHFVAETWARTPTAFSGYAAISPSLQWNGESLSRQFVDLPKNIRPPLYISIADEGGETRTGMARFLSEMDARQPLCFSNREADLVHANTLHGLLPEALQYLLPTKADWLAEYGLVLRCDAPNSLER